MEALRVLKVEQSASMASSYRSPRSKAGN